MSISVISSAYNNPVSRFRCPHLQHFYQPPTLVPSSIVPPWWKHFRSGLVILNPALLSHIFQHLARALGVCIRPLQHLVTIFALDFCLEFLAIKEVEVFVSLFSGLRLFPYHKAISSLYNLGKRKLSEYCPVRRLQNVPELYPSSIQRHVLVAFSILEKIPRGATSNMFLHPSRLSPDWSKQLVNVRT